MSPCCILNGRNATRCVRCGEGLGRGTMGAGADCGVTTGGRPGSAIGVTTTPARACARCHAAVDAALPVCPYCGHLAPQTIPPPVRGAARRRLLVLLGVVAALAVALRLGMRPGTRAEACQGGDRVTVVWRTSEAQPPRIDVRYDAQIDPARTPHVRLEVVRQTGNAVFGRNSDHEPGHMHAGLATEMARAGANAFYNDPARAAGDDRVEVTTTIAVAHPGPVPRAVRDRWFPTGRALQVFRLLPGGPAERAGVAINDLLLTVNGRPLPLDVDGFASSVASAGDVVALDVIRGGERVTVTMSRQGGEKFGFWALLAPILEVTP